MGLFTRRPKLPTSIKPDVWIEHTEGASISAPTRITRFYFTDELIGEPKRVPIPGTDRVKISSGEFMPDRSAYLALRLLLRAVIKQDDYGRSLRDMDLTRCYRHYIALQWIPAFQPDESLQTAQFRIETEVTVILGRYFNWGEPIEIGRFQGQTERFATANKLGVNWTHGS